MSRNSLKRDRQLAPCHHASCVLSEESPNELRSLVEFLNGQLKETKSCWWRPGMYDSPAGRVVSPWLFGYTEQARVAKRESRPAHPQHQSLRRNAYYEVPAQFCDRRSSKSCLRLYQLLYRQSCSATAWVYRASAILLLQNILPTRGFAQHRTQG